MSDEIDNIDVDNIEIDTSEDTGIVRESDLTPEPTTEPATPQNLEFQIGEEKRQYTQDEIQQILAQQTDFEQRQKDFQDKYNVYESIDKVAQENPDWWSHVQQSYEQQLEQAQNPVQNEPALSSDPAIAALQQQIQEQQQFIEGLKSQQQQQQEAEKERNYADRMGELKQEYPTLDWDKVDAQGRNLEQQIASYAQERQINDLDAAFKAYNFDSLAQYQVSRALEGVKKTKVDELREGILGYSNKPTLGLHQATNVKNKSYDALLNEALEEYNIND